MVELTEVTRLALASVAKNKGLFRATFALDTNLGKTVLGTTEPLIAQIRLAWWRDTLNNLPSLGRDNNPLVDLLRSGWGSDASELIELVDAWESLLSNPKQPMLFVTGRAAFTESIARKINCHSHVAGANLNGQLWAYADLANFSDEQTRRWAVENGTKVPHIPSLSTPALRPLRVLGGLARRSLERGGEPMLGDRISPLIAFRLAVFGK